MYLDGGDHLASRAEDAPDSSTRLSKYTLEEWMETQWIPSQHEIVTYHEDEHREESIWLLWGGATWEESTRTVTTHSDAGRTALEMHNWSGAQWIPEWLVTYTYSDDGTVAESISHWWRDGEWVISRRERFRYDEAGNVIEMMAHSRMDGEWVNDERVFATFDGRMRPTEVLRQQWIDGRWENMHRHTRRYDDNSRTVEVVDLRWEDTSQSSTRRLLEVFNRNGDLVQLTWQEGIGGEWVNRFRFSYTFDAQDNSRIEFVELWEDEEWNPETRRTERFGRKGNRLNIFEETWESGEWMNHKRHTFEYAATGTDADETELPSSSRMTLHQNWPNPTNGATTISFSLDESAYVSLEVFDPLGRKVKTVIDRHTLEGDHRVSVEAEDMPSGLYLYRLRAGAFETSRIMTVVR